AICRHRTARYRAAMRLRLHRGRQSDQLRRPAPQARSRREDGGNHLGRRGQIVHAEAGETAGRNARPFHFKVTAPQKALKVSVVSERTIPGTLATLSLMNLPISTPSSM